VDYFEQDGLGSVTTVSNASGQVGGTSYDGFGNTVNVSMCIPIRRGLCQIVPSAFRYTGRELDSETYLYFYRARYYDAASGRFLSEDPVRSPIQTNYYRYVRDNPPKRVDTSGMRDIHPSYGFRLVSTLKLLLWTSSGAPTPTSGWYFLSSYQEGPADYDPIATLTCLWGRDYEAEVWGHYLVREMFMCRGNDCVFGDHEWEHDDWSWQVEDLGKRPVNGPTTTTQMPSLGVEDETGDILCVTTPKLRPQGP
jgi:RHS repeat-associated protein